MSANRTMVMDRFLLEAALEGLESRKQELDKQIGQLRSLLGNRRPSAPRGRAAAAEQPRKRRMSAAGRKRIADAAKRRWAEYRKQKSAKAGA